MTTKTSHTFLLVRKNLYKFLLLLVIIIVIFCFNIHATLTDPLLFVSVFSGDDAFALRSYMMKPYGARRLTDEERIYNYRISRARRVVENAFGILANRFQVLMSTMQHQPSTIRLIVMTCMLLHNLMRTRYPRMQNNLIDREDRQRNLIPGAWRQGRNMRDCVVQGAPNRANNEGKAIRNTLRHWVNSPAGEVPWQQRMI